MALHTEFDEMVDDEHYTVMVIIHDGYDDLYMENML
jgi:hypothetical protein